MPAGAGRQTGLAHGAAGEHAAEGAFDAGEEQPLAGRIAVGDVVDVERAAGTEAGAGQAVELDGEKVAGNGSPVREGIGDDGVPASGVVPEEGARVAGMEGPRGAFGDVQEVGGDALQVRVEVEEDRLERAGGALADGHPAGAEHQHTRLAGFAQGRLEELDIGPTLAGGVMAGGPLLVEFEDPPAVALRNAIVGVGVALDVDGRLGPEVDGEEDGNGRAGGQRDAAPEGQQGRAQQACAEDECGGGGTEKAQQQERRGERPRDVPDGGEGEDAAGGRRAFAGGRAGVGQQNALREEPADGSDAHDRVEGRLDQRGERQAEGQQDAGLGQPEGGEGGGERQAEREPRAGVAVTGEAPAAAVPAGEGGQVGGEEHGGDVHRGPGPGGDAPQRQDLGAQRGVALRKQDRAEGERGEAVGCAGGVGGDAFPDGHGGLSDRSGRWEATPEPCGSRGFSGNGPGRRKNGPSSPFPGSTRCRDPPDGGALLRPFRRGCAPCVGWSRGRTEASESKAGVLRTVRRTGRLREGGSRAAGGAVSDVHGRGSGGVKRQRARSLPSCSQPSPMMRRTT